MLDATVFCSTGRGRKGYSVERVIRKDSNAFTVLPVVLSSPLRPLGPFYESCVSVRASASGRHLLRLLSANPVESGGSDAVHLSFPFIFFFLFRIGFVRPWGRDIPRTVTFVPVVTNGRFDTNSSRYRWIEKVFFLSFFRFCSCRNRCHASLMKI